MYNTAYQSSLRETPFRVEYSRDPRTIRSYESGETRVAVVERDMTEREAFLADVRYRLEQAQGVQKHHYDQQHRPVHYQVGDWALLRHRQRTMVSLPQAQTGKLKPRYIGPYRVSEIDDVVVRLELPPQARIHDVFHVGTLKKFAGTPPDDPPALAHIHHGTVAPEPSRVERARLARGVCQLLVHWRGKPPESATWEDAESFHEQFLDFQLEDELTLEGGEMSCGAALTSAVGP